MTIHRTRGHTSPGTTGSLGGDKRETLEVKVRMYSKKSDLGGETPAGLSEHSSSL